MKRWLAPFLFLCAATPAAADQLAAGLSTDSIQITSSFRGADIVLFGALTTGSHLGALQGRDIVVVLRGPEGALIVRKKARVGGLWINAEEAGVTGLPGYYYLASTQPLAAIAPEATLARLRLGASHLPAVVGAALPPAQADAFRVAAIRAKTRARLYGENGAGVERLGHYLFRVRMRLPAAVPPGRYRADVYLFNQGTLVTRQSAVLPIGKAGLERRLYDYAQNAPLAYGLATVAMALMLGWLGFAVFRQR
jgi:uncharacterized protein (TIGR02186 family)